MTIDINELLSKKDFSELTPNEKSLVLDFMTENEYASMRETLAFAASAFKSENRELAPDKNILKNLSAELNTKKEQSSIWNSLAGILFFRVPAYQAAAILIIGLIIIHYLSPAGKPVVMYSAHTDTVFVEKVINQEPIRKKSEVRVSAKYAKRNTAQKETVSDANTFNPYAASFSNLVARTETEKKGRAMQSDTSMFKYLVATQ